MIFNHHYSGAGGQTVWGLQALTGSEICMRFLNEDGEWVRCDIENKVPL